MATQQPDDSALLAFFQLIVGRNDAGIHRMLDAVPDLACAAIRTGASRRDPETFFISEIRHYVYAGDTALHVSAAAHQRAAVEQLIAKGAPSRARNRRGAEPLHYAADGSPGAGFWNPDGQRATIEYLLAHGADPNALDNSGVAALHRAVRTRSADAVQALLDGGADVHLKNRGGSTPLHLAVQNTGRSDSGSAAAKDQQVQVIRVLLAHGAKPTDTDAKGKTVAAAATSDDIRQLLT